MLRVLIAVFFLGMSFQSNADQLIIHSVSWHSSGNKDEVQTKQSVNGNGLRVSTEETVHGYNNNNFGIGYRWDSGLTVGMYYNSYRRPTVYLIEEWMPLRRFGAVLGIATGYDNVSGNPLTVIGGLIIRTPITNRLEVNVLIVPPVGEMDGVTHFSFLKKF